MKGEVRKLLNELTSDFSARPTDTHLPYARNEYAGFLDVHSFPTYTAFGGRDPTVNGKAVQNFAEPVYFQASTNRSDTVQGWGNYFSKVLSLDGEESRKTPRTGNGILRKLGNYAREATIGSYLSLVGLGATALMASGCGADIAGPGPTPTGAFSITNPQNGKITGTPISVKYTFNDPSHVATHADFVLDSGQVQHDRSLDGEYKFEGDVNAGDHRLAGYLADGNEAKVTGTDSAVDFKVIRITGNVTDRIAGGPVDGSTVTYRQQLPNGQMSDISKSATVTGGVYTIDGIEPGNHDVTIVGGQNVTHETMSVPVGGAGNFPFSVLKLNSGLFGAVYDQAFDRFYQLFARHDSIIFKWNLRAIKPQQIYVTLDGLSPQASDTFRALVSEVDNESMSDIYCDQVGSLPINYGPSIGDFRDGALVVGFTHDLNKQGTRLSVNGNVIRGANILYNADLLESSRETITREKNEIAHELEHTNGSSHALNTYRDSLMGGWADITRPSKEDKLASCIALSDDTHPGNMSPDRNPTYVTPTAFTVNRR